MPFKFCTNVKDSSCGKVRSKEKFYISLVSHTDILSTFTWIIIPIFIMAPLKTSLGKCWHISKNQENTKKKSNSWYLKSTDGDVLMKSYVLKF